MKNLNYRKDIDGLRAFAIIAVIFFHLDITTFKGGFIGVDIFFVISGYLIASIILKDIDNNNFKILDFLNRRIKRLAPALIMVMSFSMIAGWFLLLPNDYKDLGQQVVAQNLLLSNLLFYLKSGYFDNAGEARMLLHTWSLSLEWQFYIFITLTFLMIWRFFQKLLLPLIIAMFLSSFIISIYGSYYHPNITFYLLPTRLWEFLAGSLIFFMPSISLKNWISQFLAILAISTLFILSSYYSPAIYFPGLNALPVCLSAAVIIWIGQNHKTIISLLLSNRIMVFIGAISYSLYLWHWPLIVLGKYYNQGDLPPVLRVLIIIGSFILASLSWKYIEHPFRKNNSPIFIPAVCVLTALLITAGLYLHLLQGVENRFQGDTLSYIKGSNDRNPHQNECNKPDLNDIASGNICQTNANQLPDVNFMLWGDSHADAAAPAFYELSKKLKINGYILTYGGCPPILNIKQLKREKSFYCQDFNKAALHVIETKQIKHVFLIGSWQNWLNNPLVYVPNSKMVRKLAVETSFHKTIETLLNKGIHVYLLRSVPTAPFDPPRALAHAEITGEIKPSIQLSDYLRLRKTTAALFERYQSNDRVSIMDPINFMCDNENGICRIHRNGESLYYNGGHISSAGAKHLIPLFQPFLEKTKYNN